MNCPHCHHYWSQHRPLPDDTARCGECGCRWAEPKPEPPPPSERDLFVAQVEKAFWEAAERLGETYTGFDMPYFDPFMDMIDTSGGGMPPEFWHHLADTLAPVFESTPNPAVQ